MRRTPALLICLLLALVFYRQRGAPPVPVGFDAPSIVAPFLNRAGDFQSAEAEGKVILLDFWATWCPPCRRALPGLERLADRYASSEDVVIISVNCDEGGADIGRRYLQRRGLRLPTVYDGVSSRLQRAFRISALPSTVIIDPAGRVSYAQSGLPPLSDEKLADYLSARVEAARIRGRSASVLGR